MGEIFFGDTGPIRFTPPLPETAPARSLQDLELQPISQTEWRVRDARLDDDDPRKLVGFIEQNATAFGAMVLEDGHPSSWVSYASMDEALAHFVTVTDAPVTPSPSPEMASVGAVPLTGAGSAAAEPEAPAPSRGRHHPRHSAKK